MTSPNAARETEGLQNAEAAVVEDFGREWIQFDQSTMTDAERQELFDGYFAVFPWNELPPNAVGFDAGCGTGRWAVLVAPRVGRLHCVDPSNAIDVARRNLLKYTNCEFHQATVNEMPFADGSMDFGYSLGVLHHVPDTQAGIDACVQKLKPGAPLLLYLYYAMDNQPVWYRTLWKASDFLRRRIAGLPFRQKYWVSQVFAASVYYPLARTARVLAGMGLSVHSFPLSAYRDLSFYAMRTDALDRFGTKLEKRFSRPQIQAMMEAAGLRDVRFSDRLPFWCAVGIRR